MKSIAHTKQTFTMQLPLIAIAVGMLGLQTIQVSVNSLLFHPNQHSDIYRSDATSIKVTKDLIDLENEVGKNFGDIARYFNAVNDARTANLAIPNIKHFNAKLDHWIAQIDNLAASDQASVTMIVKENLGSLELLMNDVMNIPGVAPVLEPTVAQLMRNLSRLFQNHLDVSA